LLPVRALFLSFVIHSLLSWCVGLVALLMFFACLSAFGKTANVLPKALALLLDY